MSILYFSPTSLYSSSGCLRTLLSTKALIWQIFG
nr:MAG TPA: hypothetical protein [Caudoviricetes sp.]